MKKYVNNEINKNLQEIKRNNDLYNCYCNQIDILSKAKEILDINELPSENETKLINGLNNGLEMCKLVILECKNTIKNIRQNCEHHWVEDWSDSHHTYYVCDICGENHRD